MPVHDWTRVDAGLFHAFHHNWITALCDGLNAGPLPPEYFALPEQRAQGPITDVLTLVQRSEATIYADKANHITVHHRHGDVVAAIEIVSPGNKAGKAEFRPFVQKSAALLRQHVHLLIIDLLPPGKRDPQGIHKAVWDEFEDQGFELPPDKPLTLAAYNAGRATEAYVDFVAVGDVLPDMPLFLSPDRYVLVPMEQTYKSVWDAFPAALKGLLEK